MADLVAIEVAITWAASAGCMFYLVSMFRAGERGVGAQRFLIAVLAAVLLTRGFSWLSGDLAYARLTFAFATWLPLGVTLFFERVLRRHHPLWVKLFALTTSVLFFLSDMFPGLIERRAWMGAFGVCFAIVVFINGALALAQRNAGLSATEKRLVDLLLAIAFISAPLVLSDFRTLVPVFPMRLGGLAALLFLYALAGSTVHGASMRDWFTRLLALLLLALILSGLMSLAEHGVAPEQWWRSARHGWPLAFAWMLLTGIVVTRLATTYGRPGNSFLRWLARAPLQSRPDFLAALGDSPDAATHVVLNAADLADYRAAILARLADAGDGVVSVALARAQRTAADPALVESAEQWIDLLERSQMTHGFLAQEEPLTVVLVSLPATTSPAAAEGRLRVVQHLARHAGRAS